MPKIVKSSLYGLVASSVLLSLYFFILTVVSGWNFTVDQFTTYWYFIVSLAIGFGTQVGLFVYLKALIHDGRGEGKILGVTGATSTVAMVSCCAHYLVNLVPILGVTGIVSFAAQYQVELFWVGLAFNILGIVFISRQIIKFQIHQ